MRYLSCKPRDSDTRVIVDLQKVVSVEEHKPEGASIRSYTRIYLCDGRNYLLTHGFDEVVKTLQFLEHGL